MPGSISQPDLCGKEDIETFITHSTRMKRTQPFMLQSAQYGQEDVQASIVHPALYGKNISEHL